MKKGFLYIKKGTNTASRDTVYVTKNYDKKIGGTQTVGFGFDEEGGLVLDYSVTEKNLKEYRECPLHQTRYTSFGGFLLKALKKCMNIKSGAFFDFNGTNYKYNHLDIGYDQTNGYVAFNDSNYYYDSDSWAMQRHNSDFYNPVNCLGYSIQSIFINGNFTIDSKYIKMPAKTVITQEVLGKKTNDLLAKLRCI